MTDKPTLRPKEGWHVLHLFYGLEHGQWQMMDAKEKLAAKTALSALIQERAFHELDSPIQRVAALDAPIPYNRRLESAVLPQVRNIILTVRTMLNHDL